MPFYRYSVKATSPKPEKTLRPKTQVSQAQIDLLGAAFILATGGPAQTRISTGSGGSHSDLLWDGKKNIGRRR